MQEKISARGHRMVTIVDPHLKRDSGYYIHQLATEKGYYVKDRNGNDLDGWCWPGSSSYLDFTSPVVRNWWSDQFLLENYKGSTDRLYTWNDMNEPSVFNGPEVSMDKDAKSLAGIEHREWHNLYGFYQQSATAEGQVLRFVCSLASTFASIR
jgi:mannosyl-oligosaccharide alpha-1,3-glucosidase